MKVNFYYSGSSKEDAGKIGNQCLVVYKCYHKIKFILVLMVLILGNIDASGQNAIVTENAKPGNPPSEWQITGAGDRSIQGFATDISYNKGETARFKIKTNAGGYSIRIYRLGYYQGNGARLNGNATITASLPQSQPNCITNSDTGLLDCGNWNESATWAIPSTAVSGIYLAKLTRTDTGGSSHIVFIVRDDSGNSDLLFQTSDATWQAYNIYGDNNNGKSLYTGSGGKAFKVSYNRPFLTRDGGGGGGPYEDFLFNAEYPMLRWIERNGYDVSYSTNIDSDRRGELIKNHKVFISVGHDEYWSGEQRSKVAEARNAGTHLAFFSGNEVYWKTRWETSIDGTGTAYRTLVCYKEGSSGENVCNGKCDPSTEWTGLWRNGCEFATGDPLVDGCNPENALTGQISWELSDASLQVPGTLKDLRFWRNTSVASLSPNQNASFTFGTIGYEWNAELEQYRSSYPNGRILLSRTIINGKTHNLSLYKHKSGALVFGAGTVQWSWGLDSNHDRGNAAPSIDMQQATLNLFADMGVQPGSKQSNLVAATKSTDLESPVTTISSPKEGDNLSQNVSVTISGTATDNQVLAGTEVSLDGGLTWHLANGTANWSYSWTPTTQGPGKVMSRSFDDSGNIGTPTIINVQIGNTEITCPCSVFKPEEFPVGTLKNDGQALQLGMRFLSNINGFVTGVKFYKQIGNTGQHTGQLYSSTGNLLAQVVFTNETASGWQQASFSTPVAITANTTYIISYHSASGYYSLNDNGFAQAINNGPLRGLANGEDGANGLYRYTTTPAFPISNYLSSNYWVDVIFNPAKEIENVAPSVNITSPANNATFSAPATVDIAAAASDVDGSITKVEFFNGAIKLGEDLTSPYNYSWNNVPAGSYNLSAVATDDKGATTISAGITILVSAVNQAPVVNITIPTNNATFSAPATVNIAAAASDTDGSITKVEFFNGITKLAEDLSSPFTFSWTSVAVGTYTLTAVATDDRGAKTTSAGIQIAVTTANQAPAVSIISPANNATFSAPATVNIVAAASDTDGSITKVEFFNGAIKLGEDLTSPYNYSWNNVPAGNYNLTAVATDDRGTTTTSAGIQISVTTANLAPAVSITSPANNANFTAPATINIGATASDADGNIYKVEFFNGISKLGEDISSPYTFSWNSVVAGTYTLNAVATDDKGAKTTSAGIQISVSNSITPTITGFSPVTGPAGMVVVINGSNLSNATKVTFGPASATIISNTSTSIEVFVPSVKGKLPSSVNLAITTPEGSVTAQNKFTITSGTAPSNADPVVNITTPSNNSTFIAPASFTISATATDSDGSIERVEFFNGNILLGEDITSPYSFGWMNIPAGNYSLTARATDDKGAQSFSTAVNITVTSGTNAAPAVFITSPANNASFTAPANITLAVNASDSDGSVAMVEFYNGNIKLGDDHTSPYNYQWSSVDAGNYFVTAIAIDNNGASTTSAGIYLAVTSSGNLAAPSNLTAVWVSDTQVNISWQDNSDNETGFVLERATKSDFTGKLDFFNLPSNATSYQDINLNSKKGGGILYYRIKAANGNLSSDYSNSALATSIVLNTRIAETNFKEINLDGQTEEILTLYDDFRVYPNPTSGMATIEFILKEKGSYSLNLYTLQGALVFKVADGNAGAGEKVTVLLEGTQLSSGLYIIKFNYPSGSKSYRLLIDR